MNNIKALSVGVRGLRRLSEVQQPWLRSGKAVPDPSGVTGNIYRARIGVSGLPGVRTDSRRKRGPVGLGDVLPRQYFLSQLRREQRRTDRTAVPLSIAVFSFDGEKGDPADGIDDLLHTINGARRETDVVGSLGRESIAVLLPDTNEQGAKVVTERIVNQVRVPPVSAVTVTYPDQMFERLIAESQGLPGFSPFPSDEFDAEAKSGYWLKRALDILGAAFLLLVFSPVIAITALAVAMSSPGPVIFRQVRVGRRGVPFVLLKFRSMYCDSDDRIHREYVAKLIAGNHEEINQGTAENPHFKLKSDPRVTTVGGFIRKTHIDELPQLFNVLRGDMSLVGPRPPLPYEVERYDSWHLRRVLEVKPGVTGLWQVHGHNTTSFDEMVRIDIRYIRTYSLLLDLIILLKTVKVVLQRALA